MRLDRALQLEILEHLASFHPLDATGGTWRSLLALADGDEHKLCSNMVYLEGHGYLVSGVTTSGDTFMVSAAKIKITSDGMDLLLKDGGLAAIKKTLTVRFHAESLDALESCIKGSHLAPEDKRSALQAIRELPVSSVEHLTRILWEKAAESLPELFRLIGTHAL
ncbi:hypothetical protein [Pseudodesulfovibrio pelocollis]|uniref:hypothetical protein n=1 Tax=Pseudodesulfovibrio pelocollis TaxID=3051432 RepID=UPI00255AEEDA|nr:hypothetical protein [Pseudodesulfovibrio sp. SB368]